MCTCSRAHTRHSVTELRLHYTLSGWSGGLLQPTSRPLTYDPLEIKPARLIKCKHSLLQLTFFPLYFQKAHFSPFLYYQSRERPEGSVQEAPAPTAPPDGPRPDAAEEAGHKPKLCRLVKGERGYGFHLNALRGQPGSFAREVRRPGSGGPGPAASAHGRAGGRGRKATRRACVERHGGCRVLCPLPRLPGHPVLLFLERLSHLTLQLQRPLSNVQVRGARAPRS